MLFAPFLGMPIPLTALQILWINLVTDGLPGIGLNPGALRAEYYGTPALCPHGKCFFAGMGRDIIWIGLLMGLVSLGIGYWGWSNNNPAWPTMVFTTLTIIQMGNALAFRSNRDSLFKIGVSSNKPLLGAVLLTLFFTARGDLYPAAAGDLQHSGPDPDRTGDLPARQHLSIWVYEIEKWWKRR